MISGIHRRLFERLNLPNWRHVAESKLFHLKMELQVQPELRRGANVVRQTLTNPARSPHRFLRWLLGGSRRSLLLMAPINASSNRSAVRWITRGSLRDLTSRKILSSSSLMTGTMIP